MATQTPMAAKPTTDAVVEQKLQKVRELYPDAPELGKVALQSGIADIARDFAAEPLNVYEVRQSEGSTYLRG